MRSRQAYSSGGCAGMSAWAESPASRFTLLHDWRRAPEGRDYIRKAIKTLIRDVSGMYGAQPLNGARLPVQSRHGFNPRREGVFFIADFADSVRGLAQGFRGAAPGDDDVLHQWA